MNYGSNFQVTGVHIEHKIYEAPNTGKTYARQSGKWVPIDTYSKSEIERIFSSVPQYDDSLLKSQINLKADLTHVYTKTEIDAKLNKISVFNAEPHITQIYKELANIYNKDEINTIVQSIDNKISNLNTILKTLYTKDEINNIINSLQQQFTNYYTKTEIDNIKTTLEDIISQSYNKSEVYTKSETISEINKSHNIILEYIKSNSYTKNDVYNKSEVYNKQTIDQMLKELDVDVEIDAYTKQESDDKYQEKGSYLTEETDPTVPDWAKAPNKPNYTAEEVGAISLSMLDSLGAGVQYTTEEEYDNLETIQEDKFYVCLENEEVSKLYLGKFLIAKKSLKPQSNGFPYVLPITF